jgi:predicted phosphodiesterase
MRIALIGDIHSNLHALERVGGSLDELDPDVRICLGDVVGYGAFPSECVRWVQDNCVLTVQGNHDHFVALASGADRFNTFAFRALAWTAEQLSIPELEWLGELTYSEEYEGMRICHGNPIQPEAWLYVITHHDADFIFRSTETSITVVGHSHLQGCFVEREGVLQLEPGEPVALDERRIVLNPGSVGQPRDGDPRAAFALLDTTKKTVTTHRVEYDVESARQSILDAGLPGELGDRLRVGR